MTEQNLGGEKSVFRGTESLAALAKALAKAQAELKNPPKDKTNPHFRSKYADLATVRDWVLPVLNRHGLSVVQLPCEWGGRPALLTLLMHESGEYLGAYLPLLLTKQDPQGLGSALTYARRYALQALAGVAADEDVDGEPPVPNLVSQSVPGDGESLTERTDKMFGFFKSHGISEAQVLHAARKKSKQDLTEKDLEWLRNIAHRIRMGEPAESFFQPLH
jgi:hypothetical protein